MNYVHFISSLIEYFLFLSVLNLNVLALLISASRLVIDFGFLDLMADTFIFPCGLVNGGIVSVAQTSNSDMI